MQRSFWIKNLKELKELLEEENKEMSGKGRVYGGVRIPVYSGRGGMQAIPEPYGRGGGRVYGGYTPKVARNEILKYLREYIRKVFPYEKGVSYPKGVKTEEKLEELGRLYISGKIDRETYDDIYYQIRRGQLLAEGKYEQMERYKQPKVSDKEMSRRKKEIRFEAPSTRDLHTAYYGPLEGPPSPPRSPMQAQGYGGYGRY